MLHMYHILFLVPLVIRLFICILIQKVNLRGSKGTKSLGFTRLTLRILLGLLVYAGVMNTLILAVLRVYHCCECVILSKVEVILQIIFEVTRLLEVDLLLLKRVIRRSVQITTIVLKLGVIDPLNFLLDLIIIEDILWEQSLEVSEQLLVLEVGIMLEFPLLILHAISQRVMAVFINVHFIFN